MGTSACAKDDIKTVKIDGHVFHVPSKYVVQANIFFLPARQSDSLLFVINPEASLKEQMIVNIESTAAICHPDTPPVSPELPAACVAAAQRRVDGLTKQDINMEKIYWQGYATWWRYELKKPSGNGLPIVVASCMNMGGDKPGLCNSLSNYDDLVYNIGFHDGDIQHLPEIRKKVRDLLLAWEAH